MARKFSQHKIQEIVGRLRELEHTPDSLLDTKVARVANRAADLIEEMAVVVYGIQERFPETYGRIVEDVETGDKL